MARTRRAATGKTKKETSSSGDGTLTCPECGKDFARPASLGAHRNRAHGVVGASGRRAGRRSSSRGGRTPLPLLRRRDSRALARAVGLAGQRVALAAASIVTRFCRHSSQTGFRLAKR